MPASSRNCYASIISSRSTMARRACGCCENSPRSYLTIVKDLTRVMNRLKALYRSWAIPCAGRDVYYTRYRTEWLGKIREAGVRRRAEQLSDRSMVDTVQPPGLPVSETDRRRRD